MKRNSRVFLGAWLDACALWRMFIPHLNMPGSGFFVFARHPDYNLIAGEDVVVVQRCCTYPQYEFLQTLRKLGLKIVYDLDDNMWEVPSFNPAHKSLEAYREGFAHCMRWTDVISVSTLPLQKAVRNHVKNLKNNETGKEIPVIVAENRIDEKMFAKPIKSDKFIVGWAGSSSHIGDLKVISPAIIANAKENPTVRFQFRGCPPPDDIAQMPNVDFKLWSTVAEFGLRMPMWGWSIALAPLADEDFNDAKSNIKILESAYCSIPTLASWAMPYDYFTSFDPELRWLLCTPGQWESKLRTLIHDHAMREELGRRSNKVMKDRFSFGTVHEGWERVFSVVS